MAYYLTGLDRVARSTGYPVTVLSGFGSRGQGPMSAVKSIMWHHTAGSRYGGNMPSLAVLRDGRPGLRGSLSQFGVGRDGTLYVVAGGLSWHAGEVHRTEHSNPHSIGLELENDGRQPWPARQLKAAGALTAALLSEFGLPDTAVTTHREAAKPSGRKVDPHSLSAADVRRHVAAARGIDVAPAGAPALADGWPADPLPVTDKHTADSHAAWVRLLADVGFSDKRLTTAVQKWLRQHDYYHGTLDGQFGPLTVKALQRFLQDRGFLPAGAYWADGWRGPSTIRAEIEYLNSQRRFY